MVFKKQKKNHNKILCTYIFEYIPHRVNNNLDAKRVTLYYDIIIL